LRSRYSTPYFHRASPHTQQASSRAVARILDREFQRLQP
jgi:hypothetical protein